MFFIAVVIYVGMWIQSRDPALHNPREELVRMQQQLKWLEERLAKAHRENWGREMVAGIAAEHTATAGMLAIALEAPRPAHKNAG